MGIRAYKDLVVGTHPDKLELHARVMVMRFGEGKTYHQIAAETGLGQNTINNIINKYKAKQTGRDLVIIVSSKLNINQL